MKLYLVQHGKAKDKQEDPDRPLTNEGVRDVRKVGEFLAQNGKPQLDGIYHSGKARARETAETFAEYLPPGRGVLESDDLSPLDDPAIWKDRLMQAGENLMLVGHLPYMSKIAALLLCGDAEQNVVDFHKGGVVCLGMEEGDEAVWSLCWAVTPELLN